MTKKNANNQVVDKKYSIKDISITSDKDLDNTKKIISKVSAHLNSLVTHYRIPNIETSDNKNLVYKIFDDSDYEFFDTTKDYIDNNTPYTDYFGSKFNKRLFVIKLNIDIINNIEIYLFKKISTQQYKIKRKYTWIKDNKNLNKFLIVLKPYEKNELINLVNNEKDLIVDENFDFIAYIDRTKEKEAYVNPSFYFIKNRRLFEEFFGYTEKYDKAYTSIIQKFSVVDWNGVKPSLAVRRKAYVMMTQCSDYLDQSYDNFKNQLKSTGNNFYKDGLNSKKIEFIVNNGTLLVKSRNSVDAGYILKLIKDDCGETEFRKLAGVWDNFEAFSR